MLRLLSAPIIAKYTSVRRMRATGDVHKLMEDNGHLTGMD
jgi:hypothetical protein